MSYQIRPANRTEAKPLIGIYSESGCGKTWSSLLLARGFVGPRGKIVMLETEAGRGEVYADVLPGGYAVCPMRDAFSPEAYGQAITTIEKDGPDALIIDSGSHEWEGSGGVLSMAAENEANGKKGVLVWQGPKLAHQRHFVLRLLGTPIPLVILAMRAKYPMKEVKKDGRKEWVRAEIVEPVQAENILYEMMIHGWIDREHRFHGTKYTRDDLKDVIRDGEPITIQTGERLAAWARGGTTSAREGRSARPVQAPAPSGAATEPPAEAPDESVPEDLAGLRASLMAEIKAEADKRKIPPKRRAALWADHIGAGNPDSADPAALRDLLDAIRKTRGA